MDGDDWDLQAVVRGCGIAAPATRDPFSSFQFSHLTAETAVAGEYSGEEFQFPDLFAARSAVTELEELCRPFFPKPDPKPQPLFSYHRSPAAFSTSATVSTAVSVEWSQQPKQTHRPLSQISRSKRSRKNQQKRVVCHVAADGVSGDVWAWRKYGQKPIKGSPYPRGYYKCSSSKGCPARKQVERSRTDPSTLVVTYTSDHNHPIPTHRNSLAGSTRQKSHASASTSASASDAACGGAPPLENPSSSSPGLSPTTPLASSIDDDGEDDDEGELLVEDMELMGEDELVFLGATDVGEPPSFNFPWMANCNEALCNF